MDREKITQFENVDLTATTKKMPCSYAAPRFGKRELSVSIAVLQKREEASVSESLQRHLKRNSEEEREKKDLQS